jgi:EAL domain-containing protein (putative c-di-GMP-specific phosphodiesterase class I)
MIAQKILRAVEKPVWVGEHQIQISLSIGIATTENSGLDPQVLMMDADRALYAAKKSGRDTYFHFNRARVSDLHDQIALEQDLKRAINQNQFIMYYQPRFTAKGLKLSGFEALVRWNHPTRGIISPGSFLDSLHRMGLEKAFTQLTMELFFQDIHSLGAALGTQKMAFNLIPHQCLDPNFERSFVGLMNKHNISPQNICIEITEYHLMSQLERLLGPLSSLREMGVQIALDDFGEKYSSLTMLAGLPVDVLKIDKQFIQQAREDEKVARIFEAIAAMARGLNLISVAEGVEEDAHIQVATTLGCDELQGYALGKPISLAATIEKFFSSADVNPSPHCDNFNNSQRQIPTSKRRH